MERSKRFVPLVFVLLILEGCASLGGGRPLVVKAEDVLVNSLSTYDAAMTWHEANSTKESSAAYKVFEQIRTSFPPAHKTLRASIGEYKKLGVSPTLSDDLAAVQRLIAELETVWK